MTFRFLVFLGSIRKSTPPKPPRLGERVAKACTAQLETGGHSVQLIDPLNYNLGEIFKPHFSYAKEQVPSDMVKLAEAIKDADGYVMVSPEYNHSMSPALAHLLNHFGSSLFSYKPSVITTYSAGQWGGVRAAVGMRAFLSELGCLPVSGMIHVPKANEVFNDDGSYVESAHRDKWTGYLERAFTQLVWWAEAAQWQRNGGEAKQTKAFLKDPSQRNSP